MYLILEFLLIFFSSLLFSIQDIKNQKISLWELVIFIFSLVIFQILTDFYSLWIFMISAILCCGFYFVVKKLSGNKFGLGDVLFGIAQGLCVKPQYFWIILASETFLGFIYFYFSKKTRIPFIPCMSIALIFGFLIPHLF